MVSAQFIPSPESMPSESESKTESLPSESESKTVKIRSRVRVQDRETESEYYSTAYDYELFSFPPEKNDVWTK